ncbi:MAG: UpxY family transcription antiterminator [Balneolales bacterium]
MLSNINHKKWLVFYTRARSEKVCEKDINDMNIKVFLPKCIEIRQWKDRKKKLIMPLFPNYIFALVDEYERIAVLETRGIVRNLVFNGQRVEMREEEINQIELLQTQPELLENIKTPLPGLGKTIRISSGPMKGLKGEILEHYGSTHLLVRIGSIHQAVKVKLSARMAVGSP